jgi:membrane fusion protein (multidrug efflux system)
MNWKSKKVKLAALITFLGSVAVFGVWYLVFHKYVSTEDARVAMTLTRIAPAEMGGRIEKLHITEGTLVKAGDVLIELDRRMAQATYDRAQAKLRLARQELARALKLSKEGSITAQALDVASSNAASAEAEWRMAATHLDETQLKAPYDGIIVQKSAEIGNIIEAGQSAAVIADQDHAWVSANIEETAVGRVQVGQWAEILVDEGGAIEGQVSEIRVATANSFSLIPTDNGAGNFIKLVQRIPVKIKITDKKDVRLRAGQSVRVKIRVL